MEESSKPLIQRGSCACACYGSGGGGGGGASKGGQVVPRGGTEELVVDPEKGQPGHRQREKDPPPAMVAAARLAMDEEIRTAADKAIKCILRGRLTILLWLCLVDWMRRYMTTHGTEELMLTLFPLGILVTVVSVFFCLLMGFLDECMDEHEDPTNNSIE